MPDYIALTVGKIPGPVTVDDTALEFYMDDTTNAVLDDADIVEGATGWLAVSRGGQTATIGEKVDVWPCTIQSLDPKVTGNNEADKWVMNRAMGVPTKQATVT